MKKTLMTLMAIATLAQADFTRDDATSIVTDNKTKLQWEDYTKNNASRWDGAIARCEALSLGGYDDWRLPNINELKSIIVDTKVAPSIDGAFVNTSTSSYWSSTTSVDRSDYAWIAFFSNGTVGRNGKDYSNYVRCVRAGE